MSKEIPEIGDIWLDQEQRKLFLFMITPKHLHFLRRKWGSSKNRVVIVTRVRSYFNKEIKFTYLGKAKANINELFEVRKTDDLEIKLKAANTPLIKY